MEFGDGSELEAAMADMTKASARAEILARLLAEANVKYTALVSTAVLRRGLSHVATESLSPFLIM